MADQLIWGNALYDFLVDTGVSIFTYVPDGGHKVMIQRAIDDPRVRAVSLTKIGRAHV